MLTVLVSIPLVLLPLTAVPAQVTCSLEPAAPNAVEAPILAAFKQQLDAYMEVHDRVERALAPQQLFDDPEDMFEAIEAMRSGIRAGRRDARIGTIFTPGIGALLRIRLAAQLVACNEKVEDVLAFINEERLPGAPTPRIDEPFPWTLGSAMWPTLLAALPPLPDELQYRFADRDLVLIDMHADLVVDILANALPAPQHADRTPRR